MTATHTFQKQNNFFQSLTQPVVDPEGENFFSPSPRGSDVTSQTKPAWDCGMLFKAYAAVNVNVILNFELNPLQKSLVVATGAILTPNKKLSSL